MILVCIFLCLISMPFAFIAEEVYNSKPTHCNEGQGITLTMHMTEK